MKMLRETVNEFQIIASTNKQDLQLIGPNILDSIAADRRLLQRVIHNILSNALKFTPENGRIHILTETENGFFVINVEDNGPGIPEHERERIFEKFAQIDGVERRGAGLGLTFCKMVVEAHGGFLKVKEGAMGGAQFCLGLPLPIEPDPIDQIPTPTLSDTDLSFKTS